MPLFDCQCDECQHHEEHLLKMGQPIPACPRCGSASYHKLMAAPNFALKGNGWYVTDFRSPPPQGGSKPSSPKP